MLTDEPLGRCEPATLVPEAVLPPLRDQRAPRADRHIRFQLAFNVRDLGGLRAADGRTVRSRQLFRADGVHRLAGEDLELARTLALRTVIDLRTADEVAKGRFPAELAAEWHHVPLVSRVWSADDLQPSADATSFLIERYVEMVEQGAVALRRSVELLAAGAPALFHCAAGKDRTGVVAAVVLGLLGVGHEEIAADYHESAANMAALQVWLREAHPHRADAMTTQPLRHLVAPPEAMLGFLAEIDRRHGSVEGLAADLGIPHAVVARLRSTLLTRP